MAEGLGLGDLTSFSFDPLRSCDCPLLGAVCGSCATAEDPEGAAGLAAASA